MTSYQSIPALLQSRINDKKTAQRVKRYGLWEDITWSQHVHKVNSLGSKLIDMGVQPGERIALLSENRPEWLVADQAVMSTGAATVGIYTTSSAKQVKYVLDHAECSGLILENAEQIEKWLDIRESCPQVKWVIAIEPEGFDEVLAWDDIMAKAKELYAHNPEAVQNRMDAIQENDMALLMYTSGTTGNPKGAMISHKNLMWAAESISESAGYQGTDEAISYLPLSHIVERGASVIAIQKGFIINFCENLDTFAQNLQEIRPTILFAVPRIWEKMHSLVELHMRENHFMKKGMYKWAMQQVKTKKTEGLISNNKSARLGLAGLTVVQWLKYRMGLDRVRIAISGAAPISPQILMFYRSLGINIREGYGMTENSGITTLHQDTFKYGTVGEAVGGVDVKIADDGEILMRSEGVFLGYFKNPEATADVMQDGWLHTGDIGEIDADGHLSITDRKKDIIITAGGKNIAPQKIENLLKTSIFVNDAVVIGDKRKYLTALLVLDEDNISQWATEQQISYTTYSDLATNEDVVKLLQEEVDTLNKQLARVETIKKFAVLPKRLHHEDGEVTATLKVKRKSIETKYSDLIESLY